MGAGVVVFLLVGFFFTNSYTSILKLISSINFSVESEGLDLTVEHIYIYVYIYILFIYIYMYIFIYILVYSCEIIFGMNSAHR